MLWLHAPIPNALIGDASLASSTRRASSLHAIVRIFHAYCFIAYHAGIRITTA